MTPVQLPQQGQIEADSGAVSFQVNNPTSAQVEGTVLEAQSQDGESSIPVVQQAVCQTEISGNKSGQTSQAQVSDKSGKCNFVLIRAH